MADDYGFWQQMQDIFAGQQDTPEGNAAYKRWGDYYDKKMGKAPVNPYNQNAAPATKAWQGNNVSSLINGALGSSPASAEPAPQQGQPQGGRLQAMITAANSGDFSTVDNLSKGMPDLTPQNAQQQASAMQAMQRQNQPQQAQSQQPNTDALSEQQIGQNQYKQGTDAYIVSNLQQHGYSPQQIVDYLNTQHKAQNPPQNGLESNPMYQYLQAEMKNPVYKYNDAGNSTGIDWVATQNRKDALMKSMGDLYQNHSENTSKEQQAQQISQLELQKAQIAAEKGTTIVDLPNGGVLNTTTGIGYDAQGNVIQKPEKAATGSTKPNNLSEKMTGTLSDSISTMGQLQDVMNAIDTNKKSLGKTGDPLSAIVASIKYNPHVAAASGDTKAQELLAQIGQLRVPMERAMTGRYLGANAMSMLNNIIANPGNMTYGTLKNSLGTIQKDMSDKISNEIHIYKSQGKDTSELETLYNKMKPSTGNTENPSVGVQEGSTIGRFKIVKVH